MLYRYKTIVLELLQSRPQMHERLRRERRLLKTMEMAAKELKAGHEAWKEQLLQERPGSEPSQIASEAFELALKDLEEGLPPESAMDGETLSLDQAMAFLRHPSRRG